jgi:hypothetical protein
MAGFLQRYLTLCCSNDEGAAGRFDNIIRDDRQAVDFEDAFDLHEQAVKKAEVAAGDPGNRSDGLCIGEVSLVERETELAPMPGRNEGEFIALQGPIAMGETDAAVKLWIAG